MCMDYENLIKVILEEEDDLMAAFGNIAEIEVEEAEELVKQKRDNLYNHEAKLWELENEQ